MVSFVDKFADLYAKTLGEQPPPIEKLKEVNEQLSQKYVPKNAAKYPIYADQPDTYQADLMFEPYINSKKEKILQAILVVINVNTKYAFAETVDYEKNYKGMEERAWNDNSSRILLNNKDAPLVLRSFKRILVNMKNEAEALNEFEEFKNKARFDIKRLFTDEGSEFMGAFSSYCEEHGIRLTVFKANTGTKRRLAIVERFNRTLRRLMEKEMKIGGKKLLKDLIPGALDMYNRYLNNRPIRDFFRKTKSASLIKRKIGSSRFFPAMMILPGIEEEYIAYMQQKEQKTREQNTKFTDPLKPGTWVRYFKRPEPFSKSRGSTLSEPVQIVQRHTYSYATDRGTRSGPIKNTTQSDSYEVTGTTQRFMPYELVVVKK